MTWLAPTGGGPFEFSLNPTPLATPLVVLNLRT